MSPTNKHGLNLNFPLTYWPDWANYITCEINHKVKFWQNKPKWVNGKWNVIGGKRCAWGYISDIDTTDFHKCIWSRAKD